MDVAHQLSTLQMAKWLPEDLQETIAGLLVAGDLNPSSCRKHASHRFWLLALLGDTYSAIGHRERHYGQL